MSTENTQHSKSVPEWKSREHTVSFLARGDSELHWEVTSCSCLRCQQIDMCIETVKQCVKNREIHSTYSSKFNLLTKTLSEMEVAYTIIMVQIIEDGCDLDREIIFLRFRREKECSRIGHYLLDISRREQASYSCKSVREASKTYNIII